MPRDFTIGYNLATRYAVHLTADEIAARIETHINYATGFANVADFDAANHESGLIAGYQAALAA